MKKLFILSVVVLSTLAGKSQIQIDDTVSTGAGYVNQVFYKIANGAETSRPVAEWDIAFQAGIMTAGIWVNNSISTTSPNLITAYAYPNAAASSSNFTATWDTTGMNSWKKLLNPESTWDIGALNTTVTGSPSDYGWGTYMPSHEVVGDSMYLFMKGSVAKKLWIVVKLITNSYVVRTANLDGSNDVTDTLNMMPYNTTKNLVYYTLGSGTVTDREPVKTEWDLLFTRYNGTFGTLADQSVTGVLSNAGVRIAKAYPVDNVYDMTDTTGLNFSPIISTVGNNWKSLPNGPPPWVIEDSLAYFVLTNDAQLWKIVFTGFGGGANGNYYFWKENLTPATSVKENSALNNVTLYPNPSNNEVVTLVYSLSTAANSTYTIYDLAGKMIDSQKISGIAGLHTTQLATNQLSPGMYIVNLVVGNSNKALKLVVR